MLVTKTKTTREKATSNSAASSSSPPQAEAGTITSAVAAQPDLAPSKAAARLFPNPPAWKRAILRYKIKEELQEGRGKRWNWHKGAVHATNIEPDEEELLAVRKRYGYKSEEEGGPSRLYTMILADALLPLPRNQMSGVVSPPLLATTGIAPFSIFSTGPDIIQHYYDCIIAARREVVLLTNYWQNGKNVDKIAQALVDLNEKHAKRREERLNNDKETNGDIEKKSSAKLPEPTMSEKIIVKIMWDRGPQTLADLFRLRKPVFPTMWKTNGLPTREEVPLLDIEILNYHRPLMGTFHAKLLVVDRQVALVNSNNIQDRPNIESCVRLEGDIVNAVYDHALISWGNALNPPLPCLGTPAPKTPPSAAFSRGDDSTLPVMTANKLREIAKAARERLAKDDEESEVLEGQPHHFFSGQRRLSFVDVVEGVMRRDGHAQAHNSITPPSSPSPGQANSPRKDRDGSEKDSAARKAGVEWARKVLGERPHHSNTPSSPVLSDAPAHDGHASAAHNKRHLADVVTTLMEKEGIKPPVWAEGALDTFGLGPSSSRNVAEDAKRSRVAAKSSAMIHVPQAVQEDESTVGKIDSEGDDLKGQTPGGHPNEHSSMTVIEGDGDDERKSSRSESSNLDANTGPERQGERDIVKAHEEGGEEGAPGAKAFQRTMQRTISTMSKASASEKLAQITKSLDFANLSQVKGEITAEQLQTMIEKADTDAKKGSDVLQFSPFIFHAAHDPVPMALVNRRPHGTPGHSDIRNPQDAAWLAGFRYAKHHIFLQSPTLNATPIKHAILHAARRHVRIEVYLGLGFNDKSESMPFQGGTNESVVVKLFRQLRREGKGDEKYLELYWYTGIDMTRPLNAVRKQRNCHVKYISFDGQVAITGSGNMDTQSWFHSQEINVMIDDAKIVAEWDAGLKRNQSTGLYGRVDNDGIWRGKSGSERVDKGGDK